MLKQTQTKTKILMKKIIFLKLILYIENIRPILFDCTMLNCSPKMKIDEGGKVISTAISGGQFFTSFGGIKES